MTNAKQPLYINIRTDDVIIQEWFKQQHNCHQSVRLLLQIAMLIPLDAAQEQIIREQLLKTKRETKFKQSHFYQIRLHESDGAIYSFMRNAKNRTKIIKYWIYLDVMNFGATEFTQHCFDLMQVYLNDYMQAHSKTIEMAMSKVSINPMLETMANQTPYNTQTENRLFVEQLVNQSSSDNKPTSNFKQPINDFKPANKALSDKANTESSPSTDFQTFDAPTITEVPQPASFQLAPSTTQIPQATQPIATSDDPVEQEDANAEALVQKLLAKRKQVI